MTIKEQIIAKAIELLLKHPHGLRYSELLARIQQDLPAVPKNTIGGTIWNLEVQLPARVYKPARGMYIHTQYREPGTAPTPMPTPPTVEKIKEERFYEPFADWLVKELEECTKAISVGGMHSRTSGARLTSLVFANRRRATSSSSQLRSSRPR